jgi:hypothetical protein
MVLEPKIVEIGQEMTELLLRYVGDMHDVTYATEIFLKIQKLFWVILVALNVFTD